MPTVRVPPFLRYECRACGDCCRRGLDIACPPADRDRLAAVDYSADAPRLVDAGGGCGADFIPTSGGFRLALDAEGACRFLARDDDPIVREGRLRAGQCLMHSRLGHDAKLLTCRMYPVSLHNQGGETRAGLLFSCPAVVDNDGPPLSERAIQLEALRREQERWTAAGRAKITPGASTGKKAIPKDKADFPFTSRRRIDGPTLSAWEAGLLATLLGQDPAPVAEPGGWLRRLLWAADMVDAGAAVLAARAAFAENAAEVAAASLLGAVGAAVGEESRQGAWPRAEYSATERLLDRLLACWCLTMADVGLSTAASGGARWLARLRRARGLVRGAIGAGRFPGELAGVGFRAAARVETWPLPAESGELLIRYAASRLASRHYFGASSWGLPAAAGARLALRLPATALYLARGFAVRAGRAALAHDDVRLGVMRTDHVFGHLGAGRQAAWASLLSPVLRPGRTQRALRAVALPV